MALAERRFVTVLFVDLVGFTPFAEERDAEAVRDTLDRYFAIARLAVERHGGTIEKFIGDAVMAVWGTPTAHEDDAERAVRAAMELLDSVPGLGPDISARAGIVTGEAAVTIGAQGQGMVAGDLVNTASRLQSVAPAGTILVNATTMTAASAAVVFEPAGAQELKGKTAPVDAYRALRVVANRGGQNRSEGLEAPFVGREEELRLLKEQLHATTRDERARLVSISGPAGIGKSRLTWEFEKYVDGVVETIYWHRGRSPAYGEGVTFWALGEMVRRRAELAESDDEETTRRRIASTVEQWVTDEEERSWVTNSLLALLGLEPPPAGGRDILFAGWRLFFERIADQGTTVLVFEDIQWADSGMLDFIENLLEWSKNRPLLVVTLARPDLYERRPAWGSGHRLLTAMPLDPLPVERMRELLAGLVPGLPDQAVEAVLRRADGIPLYAVETVRMLVSEGRVEAVDGVYRPIGDLKELAVPETLRSLIASRLDNLEPADRSLLQDASVIGQRFTITALAAVSGLASDEIETRLRHLVNRELLDLEVDPRSPERGQYGFVQSLIREVAYGTLVRRERRSRHLAAARHFEALGDDELAGVLATHYLAAHEASAEGPEADAVAAQARIALRAAADRAAALGSHEQAVTYVAQALSVTTEPPERAALLEIAADSANASDQGERALDHARQAIDIYLATEDIRSAIRTSALAGRILIDQGRLKEAISEMESGLSRAREGKDDAEVAAVLANMSRAYMRSDLARRSIDAADRALALGERLNLDQVVAEALLNKASSLNQIGRRREAGALHQKAVEMAAAGGWAEMELRARNNMSVNLSEDDPRRAFEVVVESVALARKVGQRGIYNWQAGTAAMYQMQLGTDWKAPLVPVEETLAGSASAYDHARAGVFLAVFRTLRGEDLEHVVAQAEADINGVNEPQIDGTLELVRALVGLLTGSYAEAYAAVMRSVDAWSDFGQ
ncbi:MAG TPA: adenylate/guanylate cyclase domain-containing protein, partial [Candidatus Limnocylindrales bacterium]|nr:adenylate/guanylate cyclase domain-containing protein [Candidatus Limnocylindrales bacterium]